MPDPRKKLALRDHLALFLDAQFNAAGGWPATIHLEGNEALGARLRIPQHKIPFAEKVIEAALFLTNGALLASARKSPLFRGLMCVRSAPTVENKTVD